MEYLLLNWIILPVLFALPPYPRIMLILVFTKGFTLRAPWATLVDKKFLPLSATGDLSRHEERLYIDTSNIGLFLL